MRKIISKTPIYLLFLPFFILCVLLIFIVNHFHPGIFTDEATYLQHAVNINNGFYTTKSHLSLWNGPGWPVILSIFTFLKIPFCYIRYINAFIAYFSLIYLYYIFRIYLTKEKSFMFTAFIGLYPPLYRYIGFLFTENIAVLLVCSFCFHFIKIFHDKKNIRWHLVLSSAAFACLALTKIFLGYILAFSLFIFLFLYLVFKIKELKKVVFILSLSLLLCLPYLGYTYSLTNRFFYWGTSGGMSLYWMSTPDQNLGNWHSKKDVFSDNFLRYYRPFFAEINKYSEVQSDILYQKAAILNIKHHPLKFLRNWFANIGRLLFNYPYSPELQTLSTYLYIIPNIFLYSFISLALYALMKNNFKINLELNCIIIFFITAFLGSSLLSAYNRMFIVILPLLFVYSVIIFDKYVNINIITDKSSNSEGQLSEL